jgi:hypothetical protein
MDDFERSLSRVIDLFVALQRWSQKPEASRNPTKIFPIILDLDSQLKLLRRADREHPLQPLAREVRSAFDNREFRAILLAAFNWRSGHRPKPATAPGKPQRLPRIQRSCTSQDNAKFLRDFLTFINGMNMEQQAEVQEKVDNMRKQQARLTEHVDIFKAGRRLPCSYGSTQ